MSIEDPNEKWERGVLEKLAFASLQEQRRARHWGIFFKVLTFVYLFALLFIGVGWIGDKEPVIHGPHTALVELKGLIAPDAPASADTVTAGLQEAFKDRNTKGVILRINSPGGSPVQAHQINEEIGRLRAKHPEIPLYAVVDDMCASGGYYVAVAADKIFVSKASLLGSIGVIMNGFGFTGAMEKLGVERRVLTAGENKDFLDPFAPLNARHEAYAKHMLQTIHEQFIDVVRRGRGDRLKESPDTFSGLVWTGEESIANGLADALGTVDYVAREIIKAEKVVDYTPRESFPERLAKRFGSAFAATLAAAWGPGTLR